MAGSFRRSAGALAAALLVAPLLLAPLPASAVDYLNVTVQPDRAVPGACFTFTAPLPRAQAGGFEPYLAITPAVDHAVQPRGKDLCVTGFAHGKRYAVRLKAGLPAADGTALPKDVSVDVTVPDREATLSFANGKTLLPLTPGVGLPLRSVNVSKAHLAVYRLGDRALAEQAGTGWFGQPLSGYNLNELATRASKVFEGRVDIADKPNQDLSTALPVDGLVKGGLQPGVYAAVATIDGRPTDDDVERATQWFSVSDIGLLSVKAGGGMLVLARSLQTAEPLPGVTVRLIARGNDVLGTYATDASGRATIPPGLLRGEGGDAARLVTAQATRGDYTWLQVDAPSLDLSDLDTAGRTPPGPLDAYLWTDRGIYRPGEVIHLGALLRDARGRLAPATPLTLHLVRPDGVEVDKLKPTLDKAGGGSLDIPVPDNAYSGEWTVWAGTGNADEHIGTASVTVQDFVPPRLDAKIEAAPGAADAKGPITATVDADYFYGSPGADLTGNLEATIQPGPAPFQTWPGYSFGLVQEPFLPKQLTAQDFTTDDHGRATVTVQADDTPDSTGFLQLALRATVNDVDGRAVVAEQARPLHTGDRYVGIKPDGAGDLAENATAGFGVALVDAAGKPLGPGSLKWDLVKEDHIYNWFYRDGRWQSEDVVNDARVNGGEVAVGPDGAGHLAAPVTSGTFRLEVYDADGKAASSLRFGAGWAGEADADNRKPDVLPLTVDAAAPPGKVRVMLHSAFKGRVAVMLDGDGLHQVGERPLAKGDGAVEFNASDVPPSGAYVLAVAVSEAGAVVPRLPVRAVGLAWVPGAAAGRKLDVSLDAPDTVRPKTKLAVNVSAAGAPRDQPVYVTVAAVDEAVLRMTDFATPDPAGWYVGRRAPDLELRDVYGSLIDPDGHAGRLVEGGDSRASKQMGGLDVKTFKTVALFSGPVALDASGRGSVSFDVPDFSGRLRLMAVAWSADRFGAAERPVTVRPPLLAELTLPRFLSPGDRAQARVMLTDLEAPEQTYRVAFTTSGAVALDRADALFKDVKRDRRRYVDRTLTATGALGAGHIHMTVTGDDGTVAERDFDIGVRSPNAFVTVRQVRTLDPGQKLSAGDALGQDLLPGTGTLDVTAATVPAFDVPGLLAELRRYPYGCAEQTVSRAFPELFATAFDLAPKPGTAAETPQAAVARLYSLQAADGSFGYWTALDGSGAAWLTSYVLDFLQHAQKAGVAVPEGMVARATTWLAGRFATAGQEPGDVAGAAYASLVLARAGKLDLSQLRYVAARVRGALPSDIARVQLVSALTRTGERGLAADLMKAGTVSRDPKVWLDDYGSPLRDAAMALSLASEEHLLSPRDAAVRAEALVRQAAGTPWLSTQEEVWLLRAAFDLKTKAPLDVVLDGREVTGKPSAATGIPLGKGRSVAVENRGRDALYLSLATTGVPTGAPPPEANGFSVTRTFFHLDGGAADLADVHQNDELVVVVEGAMTDDIQRKVLLVDMLPAGLEPETVGLTADRDANSFAWLKDLTTPTFTALRDDRYLAGLDLTREGRGFKLAYVVRAVTPGTYAQPGTQVEDMYAPAYHARTAAFTLEVKGARKP